MTIAMPDVTPANAHALATAALDRIEHPLRGYVFDGPVSLVVALAMFLSAVAVHATRTRPGFLVDAPVFGSGKTMLIELVAIMMTGSEPPLISLADSRASEERDKQLDAALLRGAGYVAFDNARGDLADFGKLVVLLTATTIPIRIFHTQSLVDIRNNFLVLISGNNVSTSGDIARRVMRCRIDTGEEFPDRKRFDFDPRDEVAAARMQLAIDCLTVIRAYQIAGSPNQSGRAYGSFEEWTRLVRDPLMWLGLPDIVPSNDEATADDQTRGDLAAVIEAWELAQLTEAYTCEEFISCANTKAPDGSAHYPALHSALLAVAADKNAKTTISSRRLGWWFKNIKGRRIGNLAIVKTLDAAANVSRYQLADVTQPNGVS